MPADPSLAEFAARLDEILSIRTVHEHLLRLLTLEQQVCVRLHCVSADTLLGRAGPVHHILAL